MSNAMRLLPRWYGLWTGTSEHESTATMSVRTNILPVMEGRGFAMQTEMFDPSTGTFLRGVRFALAVGPDGRVQTVGYSTEMGVFGLEETPDDEDVLALSGVTESGIQLNVTYREESPDTLMFSVFWRPHGASLGKNARPGLFGRIHRRQPWRPPAPQGGGNPV
ncbi:MAG: hypothetical protein H6840_12280 [Planctomycetes bacterium]|nr:hypothetical protein [Planctomycetota bacterium]